VLTSSQDKASTTPRPSSGNTGAIARARRQAAEGGWPDAPVCAFAARRKTFWAWSIATFFGTGFGKPGPGTWGSAAASLLFAAAVAFHPAQSLLFAITLAGSALSIATGIPAATIAARESGRHDPGFVVIDEVAGQWITLLALTLGLPFAPPDAVHILFAFLLFRLFDIVKPFPIRRIEKLPAGWGIVFDDVAAGLYAGAVLLLASRWLP
jgi:phosphatidylglycerophosphatase A